MDTAAIRKEIEEMIKEKVRDIGRPDLYREPMVGFVSVDDPSIVNVKDIVGPWHDSPDDQLPGARTIIAYTVPFTREVAMDPGNAEFSGLTWSEAYVIINKNFELISKAVADYLRSKGYEAATVTATNDYDPSDPVSSWSHRTMACAAGRYAPDSTEAHAGSVSMPALLMPLPDGTTEASSTVRSFKRSTMRKCWKS